MDGSAVKDDARPLPAVLVVCKPVQLHGSRKCRAELHDDSHRQDEHVAVRELRISLPVEHRRVLCAQIGGEVVRQEVVPVSPNLAVERGVVDAEFTGVGILRE